LISALGLLLLLLSAMMSSSKANLLSTGPQRGHTFRPKRDSAEDEKEPIVPKMTHLEKMYNFCNLSSVQSLAANTYKNDFVAMDSGTKQGCGRLRCTGSHHICCPINGKLNGTGQSFFCLTNNQEHRGECPVNTVHVSHLDYSLAMELSTDRRMQIQCRRDGECRRNQKCCMSTKELQMVSQWMDRYTTGDRPWEMVPSKSVKCYDAERTEDNSGDEVQMGWKMLDDEDVNSMKMKLMETMQKYL